MVGAVKNWYDKIIGQIELSIWSLPSNKLAKIAKTVVAAVVVYETVRNGHFNRPKTLLLKNQ